MKLLQKHKLQALINPNRYTNPSQAIILNDANLSISTLQIWAEMDSPDEYKSLIASCEADSLTHIKHKVMWSHINGTSLNHIDGLTRHLMK